MGLELGSKGFSKDSLSASPPSCGSSPHRHQVPLPGSLHPVSALFSRYTYLSRVLQFIMGVSVALIHCNAAELAPAMALKRDSQDADALSTVVMFP